MILDDAERQIFAIADDRVRDGFVSLRDLAQSSLETIERLHAFIREQGYSFEHPGLRHHEIYLGDPRRSAPEKLRTIIRQPYGAR